MDENQVKVLIQEEMSAHCSKYVEKEYCVEKHKEVTSLSEAIKKLDNRIWALVLIGLGQLVVMIAK
jgi:hypothetical protein